MKIEKILLSSLAAFSLTAQMAPQPPAAEKPTSSKAAYRRFLAEHSYIRPPLANHIDAPLPESETGVLGIYGNILYPEDRESAQRKKLFEWIEQGGSFPLTESELNEISFYILERIPQEAFLWCQAKNGQVRSLKELADKLPLKEGRFSLLRDKLLACEESREMLIGASSPCEDPDLVEAPYKWEMRLGVLKQMVEKTAKHTPYFLALQEVTPQALADLKTTLADRNLQWISLSNVSGKPTLPPGEELVPGEATSFTSTVALSPELKILKVDLGDLPTESGSIRKIMGVRVLNEKTLESFDIFTTHTDHKIQNDIYLRTAEKIHAFVTRFQEGASIPFVLGGDLNAFPHSEGHQYIERLRELFPESRDFRETDYYAPSPIAWSTFIGRPFRLTPILIEDDGTVAASGLDQVLVNGFELEAASREALIYSDSGELLDYHTQKEEYLEQLKKRVAFSDHLFNLVRLGLTH